MKECGLTTGPLSKLKKQIRDDENSHTRISFDSCVLYFYKKEAIESYKASKKRIKNGKGTPGAYEKMETFFVQLQQEFPVADNLYTNSPLPDNLKDPDSEQYYLHPNLQKLMHQISRRLDKDLEID